MLTSISVYCHPLKEWMYGKKPCGSERDADTLDMDDATMTMERRSAWKIVLQRLMAQDISWIDDRQGGATFQRLVFFAIAGGSLNVNAVFGRRFASLNARAVGSWGRNGGRKNASARGLSRRWRS
jgi:hypothetical protein